MSKPNLCIKLNSIRSTNLCKFFLKKYTLTRNSLENRGNVCHISNKNRIIRHESIPNNTKLTEISFNFSDVHTTNISFCTLVITKLIFIKGSNLLLLLCTSEKNHVVEISTIVSHFKHKFLNHCSCDCTACTINGVYSCSKFKHTPCFVCNSSRSSFLIRTTKERKFYIPCNLNKLLLNLPSLFIRRVRVLPSSVNSTHSATVRKLCISQINNFLMNLNNIAFLTSFNSRSSGSSSRSSFRNFRLCSSGIIEKNRSREFIIISLLTTSKPTNHRKKRGLCRVSSKKFTRIVGQIPSSTNTSNIIRHNQYHPFINKKFVL